MASISRHSVAASIPVEDWAKLSDFVYRNNVKVSDVLKRLVHGFVRDMPTPDAPPEDNSGILDELFPED